MSSIVLTVEQRRAIANHGEALYPQECRGLLLGHRNGLSKQVVDLMFINETAEAEPDVFRYHIPSQEMQEGKELATAKELEIMERNAQLKAELLELAATISLWVLAALAGAAAFYLLCAGFVLLRQEKQPATEVTQEHRQVIPFPGLPQRARVLANAPATAVALLLLGVAVFTASATLL